MGLKTYVCELEDSVCLLRNVGTATFFRDLSQLGADELLFISAMGSDSFNKILERLLKEHAIDTVEHVKGKRKGHGESCWRRNGGRLRVGSTRCGELRGSRR